MTTRVSTGSPKLDEMLGGGLLPGTLTVVYGATGIGKTHLGLGFCHHGRQADGEHRQDAAVWLRHGRAGGDHGGRAIVLLPDKEVIAIRVAIAIGVAGHDGGGRTEVRFPDGQIGAVYDPPHDELFFATKGGGATLNGRPMHVSSCARLDRALVMQGYVQRHDVDAHLRLRTALITGGAEVKDHGAGALMLAHVAAGRFDAYLEPHMHPWDASAGVLLVDEAGGRTLPYPGPQGLRAGGAVVASAPALYERLHAMAGW